MRAVTRRRGFLPRLAPQWYRGTAVVFWTHTVEQRGHGWLSPEFHNAFRELMLHAAMRERLIAPIYTLMPDHVHLIWMGVAAESDQRVASSFLRTQLEPYLAPHRWQRQPHDHVLDAEERQRGALAATCHYIAENPVRANIAASAGDWAFTGAVVPGYPKLHPCAPDFWDIFWRIHSAAVEHGRLGKISL